MAAEQNFENHSKLDPLYHFAGGPLMLGATMLAIGHFGLTMLRTPQLMPILASGTQTLLVLGALITFLKVRVYALKVQDRVIALEVTLRYQRLGGTEKREISEFLKPGQIVALRFASDEELVALVEKARKEETKSVDIKRAIKSWRADHRRI